MAQFTKVFDITKTSPYKEICQSIKSCKHFVKFFLKKA